MKLAITLSMTVFFSLLISHETNADIYKYSWNAVPKADYYDGTLESDRGTINFRTRETWVLLEEGSQLTLQAISNNRPIKNIVPDEAPISVPEKVIAEEPEPEPEPEPEQEPEQEEPEQEEPEQEEQEEPEQEEPEEVEIPNTSPSVQMISVELGYGTEKIVASGGKVDDLSIPATVGGTTIRWFWHMPSTVWSIRSELSTHNITTNVDSIDGESDFKHLRYHLNIGGYYEVLSPLSHGGANHLGLGIGFGTYQLPIVATSSEYASTDDFDDEAIMGVVLGLDYKHTMNEKNAFGTLVNVLPYSFSDVSKALSYNLLLYWRYFSSPKLYMELGLIDRHEMVEKEIDCSGVSGECEVNSSTKSDLIQGRIGIGMKF